VWSVSFPVPVAPFLHVITPLRLGVIEAGPHAGNATEGETDRYRVRLRPLSGANVCVVPSSFEDMKSVAEWSRTFGVNPHSTGRTNTAGHVLWSPDWETAAPDVAVRELEHPLCSWACDPPTALNVAKVGSTWADPRDQARVRHAEPGRLFWTYHADAFRAFMDALWLPANSDGSEPSDTARRASFSAAVEQHWLFRLGHLARPTLPLLDLPTLGTDERLRVQELLLVPPARTQDHLTFGHANDDRFTARDRMGYPHAGVIYDATPPALRALYAAEWVARCVVHLRKQGAEDWATLHRAGEVARAYSDGEPVREQELALFGSFGVPSHGGMPSAHAPGLGGGSLPVIRDADEIQAWVEGLRGFALACARSEVRRDQVASTLEDLARHVHEAVLGPPNANPALRQLATELGPRLASHAQLSAATRDATLDYFDVYDFGRTLVARGLRDECDAHAQGIDDAVRWVSTKAERLLSGGLPYDEFAVALWTRIPDDAAREALHRRFEEVHFAFQVPFWGTSISLERWDALRPALQWMQAATSQAASVWSALIESEVHAYAKLLQEADAANQMLNFLYRHHRARAGEALQGTAEASHTVWKGIVRQEQGFRINFDTGVIELLTEHGSASSSPPVRFVQNVAERVHPPVATELGSRLRASVLTTVVVDFQVEVAADTRRWDTNAPTYLKAFANTLNMGLIVSALHTKAQRLDLYACVDLSQGALASVESLGAVLYALNRPHGLTPLAALQGGVRGVERANQLYHWAAQAGRAAGAISVVADLLGGLRVFQVTGSSRERILRGDAEGDVADAARRGDDTLYDLYVAQGALKLLAGTGGAVMLATGISSGPLAVGVLTCGVLVLLCDGAIAVHQANQPAVTAFISRVYQARERELQHVERGGDADGESGTSLTARRIATLNARLRDALEA
jgi:hypothetical protein